MVRLGAKLIIGVAIAFVLQSCSKTKEDCSFLAPDIVYVGFTQAETDTFIIRRFEKNTNFIKPLDTLKITRAHIDRIPVGEDSVKLVPDNYSRLSTDFYLNDWEIYFPAMDRTVYITNAVPQFTQEKEASALCHSYVSSVNFDNRVYQFSSWFDTPYRVYVTK
jgi:hypothetical protein